MRKVSLPGELMFLTLNRPLLFLQTQERQLCYSIAYIDTFDNDANTMDQDLISLV